MEAPGSEAAHSVSLSELDMCERCSNNWPSMVLNSRGNEPLLERVYLNESEGFLSVFPADEQYNSVTEKNN